MLSMFTSIKIWLAKQLKKIAPGTNSVKGASLGVLISAAVLYCVFAITIVLGTTDIWSLAFLVFMAGLFVINAYLTVWLLSKVVRIPKPYKLALLIASPLLFISLAFEALYWLAAIVISSLLGAGLAVIINGDFKYLSKVKKVITVTGLGFGIIGVFGAIYAFFPNGFEMKPMVNAAALSSEKILNIAGDSPSEEGHYSVKSMTYGSGNDKHRKEFNSGVSIQTNSVNGLPFIDNWSGLSGWYRERFWGFNVKELPVNAYVWYPEGEGPFPLVLMVHGNHSMDDFSDVGYAYLGELLASRGIIFASVDQNFINASWADIAGGLEEENDARGWLLLEHLSLWHQWNADEESPFFQKVDTEKLSLIGHSRGGEAVAHAALLNNMPYYYDDASIPLNYNFNIQSIVAIAPVDGQYEPGNASTSLKDISYLVIHGAQDGDVSSFLGANQYERITFSKDADDFKAGLYIAGANHGQFNTSWGDNDVGGLTKLLNNKQLITAPQQRKIAKVYISAFMETTLLNNEAYLPLFKDPRKGKDWLPETIYLSQFEHSEFSPIATFDEDFNVLTTTNEGLISGENLSAWREQEIELKWRETGSRGVYIGWHYEDIDAGQTIPGDSKASYTLTLASKDNGINENSIFSFSLAESGESSNPKSEGKWVDDRLPKSVAHSNALEDSESTEQTEENLEEKGNDEAEAAIPIDFTIVFEDETGEKIAFPLSLFSALQPPIKVRVWKSQFIFGEDESENVFQTFSYPLSELREYNITFDFSRIRSIKFSFDKNPKGAIILDQIGFM